MSSSRRSGFRHLHGRMAVDLALVADVLPDIGPALAPMVLAADGGSYAFLSAVAGACALASAGAILRVRQVR
jgi:hypothetical protein